MGQAAHISGPATLPAFCFISFYQSLIIGHTFLHEPVFHQKVVDEKAPFVILRFPVNPELVLRDASEAIMLSEIRKFFVNMGPNITAIDNPYLQIASLIYLFKIRQLEL
jgi:hypothetical protein